MADFNNWRVIEQSELSPIVEAISGIPGYGKVKEWFLSAIPKLSQYVVIPESRVLHVRFKAINHAESPALERITGVKVRWTASIVLGYYILRELTDPHVQTQGYLGHNPEKPPKPIRTSLKQHSTIPEIQRGTQFGPWGLVGDITVATQQVTTTKTEALFFPHS